MIRKILISFIGVLFVVSMTRTFADPLPDSEFCLNDIRPGVSMEYVRSIYGEPTLLSSTDSYTSYRYGDSLYIRTYGYGSESVAWVEVTANNGFATPSGLAVGMSLSNLFELYGRENAEKNTNGEIFYVYPRRTSGSGSSMLVFVTGKRISAIRIVG